MASHEELVRAVDLALEGNWDGAHTIVQSDEDGQIACWIHAVLHKIEGDQENSRYWYRRAGQFYESYANPNAELKSIRAALTY